MRTEARFPALDMGARHYESFYLKAVAPEGGRALWIRHTIHQRPGAEPTCSIWFTSFNREEGLGRATKASFSSDQLSFPAGTYVRVAGAEIGPGEASGRIETEAVAADWQLSFEDRHEALRHLPSERLYRSSLPRTKLLSPHPGALFKGSVTIDGTRTELSGWPGMVGHNWGTEHAERWVWIHGVDFEGGGGDYVDIAAGRIKIGPMTTPWVANGALVVGGESYRLGGLGKTYGTDLKAEPTGCEFVIPGKRVTIRGKVSAPKQHFVGWIYADPGGGEHHAVNCSIADLEMRVERPSHKHVHLKLPAGAVYELGMRETDHGIPILDYPDG